MSVSKPTPKISINEFVNNLYKRYIEASRKEEQKRRIEEIIKQLDIKGEWTSIWSSNDACWEYITMLPEELENRIKEIWNYEFKDYRFISAGIHITTCRIEDRENARKMEREVLGEIITISKNGFDYLNYIKIAEVNEVKIYLVVSDEEIEGDC